MLIYLVFHNFLWTILLFGKQIKNSWLILRESKSVCPKLTSRDHGRKRMNCFKIEGQIRHKRKAGNVLLSLGPTPNFWISTARINWGVDLGFIKRGITFNSSNSISILVSKRGAPLFRRRGKQRFYSLLIEREIRS